MSEYIVRETGYPGVVKQEVIGELVRCKDCKYWDSVSWYCPDVARRLYPDGYCHWGERKDDDGC